MDLAEGEKIIDIAAGEYRYQSLKFTTNYNNVFYYIGTSDIYSSEVVFIEDMVHDEEEVLSFITMSDNRFLYLTDENRLLVKDNDTGVLTEQSTDFLQLDEDEIIIGLYQIINYQFYYVTNKGNFGFIDTTKWSAETFSFDINLVEGEYIYSFE